MSGADFPGYSHGTQRMPDGRVRFRLWAPAVEKVTLHLQDQALPMQKLADGWFETLQACAAGAIYCYEPAGVGRVADPASRQQCQDAEGPSAVVDHDSYTWCHADWRGRPWHETVLYEVHPGLLGGFKGLRSHLSRLAEVGFTALQLMPIADFPGARNWGYDGVLPYAPDRAYGSPDELKAMIDEAHGLGLMVFLDVVYNHFGPVGNRLPSYAPQFFRDDAPTPWGPAIDFRREPVRSFFAENALYWLKEYRFDGLRFDAVHAIVDEQGWLAGLAHWLRSKLPADRHVHLVLENDDNAASLLRRGFDAQWNDDIHHVVHHLLTGELTGYYAAYAERSTEKLARALDQGFIYQGEASPAHGGRPRGELSYMLPPTAFVFFLQNHDQVGNRPFGERLSRLCSDRPDALIAAVTLQLLSPFIPLVFMGEELGTQAPFLYFTCFDDPEFAAKVKEGRHKEFADFHRQTGLEIPDPNSEESWLHSQLPPAEDACAQYWMSLYRTLLALRAEHIVPGLLGAKCESTRVLAPGCLTARWVLSHGGALTLHCNLSERMVALAPAAEGAAERWLHESKAGAARALRSGRMPPYCTVAGLSSARRPQVRAA